MYHRHSIQTSAMVYGALTYGHHEAKAVRDHSAKPTLAKAEAWRVGPAPGDSEILLVRGLIVRHDLAVHGRTLIHGSLLYLGVVES